MQAEQVTVIAVSSVAAQVAQPVILLSHFEHCVPWESLKLPVAHVSQVLLQVVQLVQPVMKSSHAMQIFSLRKVF